MQNVVVMGAFGRGRTALDMLCPDYKVIAFYDPDPQWIGKTISGIPVYSEFCESPNYKDLSELDFHFIIIATTASEKIKDFLTNKIGVPLSKIFDIYNGGILDVRVGTLRCIANELYLSAKIYGNKWIGGGS